MHGRIFATLPDDQHLHVFVDLDEIHLAVAENPLTCEGLWWGTRLRAVRVDLHAANGEVAAELLKGAWQRKAPLRLQRGQHSAQTEEGGLSPRDGSDELLRTRSKTEFGPPGL